jgi:hypothetical protein
MRCEHVPGTWERRTWVFRRGESDVVPGGVRAQVQRAGPAGQPVVTVCGRAGSAHWLSASPDCSEKKKMQASSSSAATCNSSRARQRPGRSDRKYLRGHGRKLSRRGWDGHQAAEDARCEIWGLAPDLLVTLRSPPGDGRPWPIARTRLSEPFSS